MKLHSETQSIGRLKEVVSDFKSEISRFERRAKDCLSCETKGACCLDAHFVNVHISRLEATAINRTLDRMPAEKTRAVRRRIEHAITEYRLTTGGDSDCQTFACPLFEKGTGCLVHNEAKPLPCIAHACYETAADLPPDELLAKREREVERLNAQTYGRSDAWLPLPLALVRYP